MYNMNTKSKKLNANNIINARKKLDNELKRKWSIMKSENTLRKSAVKTCRLHNLATIHNQILQNIEKRIIVKGILNNINNGISTFNTEEFKKSHYHTIFRLQETREQITKLNEIREKALKPQIKAQKGKKRLGFDEVFSYEKLTTMINHLTTDVNTLLTKIENYNNTTEIEITDDSINDILAA